MGEMTAIMLMSMKKKDRIGRLARGLRDVFAQDHTWLQVVTQTGRYYNRHAKDSDRPWTGKIETAIRDYLRTALCLNMCSSQLAQEVGLEALRQARLAHARAISANVPDLLLPGHRGRPHDRSRRIAASWFNAKSLGSYELDLDFSMAYFRACVVCRTPGGLVAVQTLHQEHPKLIAALLRSKRTVQLQRHDNGVFLYLDGVKHTVPEVLVLLGLGVTRPLPEDGSDLMPKPPLSGVRLIAPEGLVKEQRERESEQAEWQEAIIETVDCPDVTMQSVCS